jgi:hypothetical protein
MESGSQRETGNGRRQPTVATSPTSSNCDNNSGLPAGSGTGVDQLKLNELAVMQLVKVMSANHSSTKSTRARAGATEKYIESTDDWSIDLNELEEPGIVSGTQQNSPRTSPEPQ